MVGDRFIFFDYTQVMRNKVLTIFVLIGLFCHGLLKAQDHFLNLSLLSPLSIVQDTTSMVNVNLSLLHGKIGSLRGISFGLGIQTFTQEMKGISFTGLLSYNKGDFKGAQFSLGPNINSGNGKGLLWSIVGNLSFGQVTGVQLSSVLNSQIADMTGLQSTAGINLVGGDFKGVELATMNVVSGNVKGCQLSGAVNVALDTLNGLQLSAMNFTGHLSGVQIGFLNYGVYSTGVQIGFLNVLDSEDGLQIGLVNVKNRTRIQWIVGGGNLMTGISGARFLTDNHYSILYVGSPIKGLDDDFSGGIGYRYGWRKDLKVVDLSADLGLAHITSYNKLTEDYDNTYSMQLRANIEKKIMRRLSIFVTGGYYWIADSYKSKNFSSDAMFEVGLFLF